MDRCGRMVRGLLLGLIIIAWLPGTSQAAGETWLGDKVSLDVGYKVWLAKWQSWSAFATNQTSPGGTTGPNQITSSFEPLQGPEATLTLFNRLVLNAQYLNSSFGFHDAGTNNTGSGGTSVGVSRNDFTLTAGVRVWRGFGVFAGYYQQIQHWEPDQSFRIKGPVAGVFGTVPLSETPFSVYGNFRLGWQTLHTGEPGSQPIAPNLRTENVKQYAGELGVHYTGPTLWKVGTSAQVGFRYMVLEETFGPRVIAGVQNPSTRINEITWGPTFMVSAKF